MCVEITIILYISDCSLAYKIIISNRKTQEKNTFSITVTNEFYNNRQNYV